MMVGENLSHGVIAGEIPTCAPPYHKSIEVRARKNNSLKVSWLLLILFIAFAFAPPEISWLVCFLLLLIYLFSTPGSYNSLIQGVRHIRFFVLLPFVGIFQMNGHTGVDIVRDLWIFTLPIIPFLVGWVIAMKVRYKTMIQTIMLVSTLLSIVFVLSVFSNNSLSSFGDQDTYRQEIGSLDMLVVFNCLIAVNILWHGRGSQSMNFKLALVSLPLSILAIALLSSRTPWGILLIGLLFVWIPSLITRYIRVYWSFIAGLIFVVFIMGWTGPSVADRNTFSGRTQNSVKEVATIKFENMGDIHSRYRSYEALMAAQTYLKGNAIQLVLGQGLGALVDLETVVELGSDKQDLRSYQYIPVLHNGYMYLLVKIGLIGLLLYLAQLYTIWQTLKVRFASVTDHTMIRLGRSILLATLFTTFVIGGPFNKGSLFSSMLLLGITVGAINQIKLTAHQLPQKRRTN